MIEWAVSPWFDLVLLLAMTARVTRLVVDDDLFVSVRAWADRQEAYQSHWFGWWIGKVTGCAWCCSPYVAAGAWTIWFLAPAGVFVGAGIVCAGSLVAGLIGDHA